MGIYCANQEVIHCFMYDESIAGAGPNEVITILDYFPDGIVDSVFDELIRFFVTAG